MPVTFVLATPISGPALMWTPQWDSRLMVEPTVLVIPITRAPRSLQYLRAARVSAVSPDWEMKTHASSRNIGVFLSRKSEAKSAITASWVSSSSSCLEAIAEW